MTDAGREYLEEQGCDVEHRGRGGIVHRYWQHRITELFEAVGWPAKVELFDADVYVNMDGTELVVEVAMGDNEREIEHVKQHLETGFDAIWLVCPSSEIRDALRERLAEKGALDESVAFHLFQDILRAEQESLEQFTDFSVREEGERE